MKVTVWMVRVLVAVVTVVSAQAAAKQEEQDLWLTDFQQARKTAAEKNIPILADFTGSDWCGWCIRLTKEVFSTPEFKAYADEHLVLLKIDFPRSVKQSDALVKQNRELQQRFGIRGFPTIILLDAEGKELARTGYRPGGAEAYVAHLKGLLKN